MWVMYLTGTYEDRTNFEVVTRTLEDALWMKRMLLEDPKVECVIIVKATP